MKKLWVSLLLSCFWLVSMNAQAPAPAAPAASSVKKKVIRKKGKGAEVAKDSSVAPAPKKEAEKKGKTESADKVIGKDAKGREIYQGPKGGQYYLVNGKKQYLPKDEKIKVN